MARKRAAESDAEEADNVPKRARVEAPNGAKAKGKGKASNKAKISTPVADSSDEASIVELPGPPEERVPERVVAPAQTDAEFERINASFVKEAIARRGKPTGAAEAGIITRVELVNFMCHKLLSFNFGPQINFIIGHNGSGKSAALSAITVALGGKAASTGRASGLKSFIKSGETAAEVSITIKNGGHEPYRPEVYGESITVARHFTQSGSTSYKIKNEANRTVCSTREELSAILDHFSIDVDNPMNILTQDLARQFLSASNGSEKYALFLKGTLLTQLREEYDQILENTNKTKAVLMLKKSVVDDLGTTYHEVESRWTKAKNLQEAEGAIEQLKGELAWAHIADQEQKLSTAIVKTTEATERADQIKAKVAEAQAKVAASEEKINDVETRVAQAATPAVLMQEQAEVDQQIREGKEELIRAKRDVRDIGDEIKRENRNLQKAEREIEEANAVLAQDAQREQVRARIERAHQAFTAAESKANECKIDATRARDAVEAYRRQLSQVEHEFNGVKEQIMGAETRRDQIREAIKGTGGPAIYGNWVENVLKIIQNTRWTGERPLGPLGLHVKLKDKKWAKALRLGIGNLMGSFAVTNYQDQLTLKKILADHKAQKTNIIVGQPDLFDYSGGEPSTSVLTVLRALDINNEWVKRIMINSAKIERTILADTREHAERLLNDHPRFMMWTADGLSVRRFSDGGGQTAPLGRMFDRDFRNVLFREGSEREDLAEAERRVNELAEKFQDVSRRKNEANQRVAEEERKATETGKVSHQATIAAKNAHRELNNAKAEDIQEKPIDLTVLEEAAESSRSRIADLGRQIEAARQVVENIDARNKPLVEQSAALRRQIGDYEEHRKEIKLEVEEAVAALMIVKDEEKHYQRRLDAQQETIQQLTAQQTQLEQEYANWLESVSARYEKVEKPRSVKVVEKELNNKQQAHQRSLEEQGQPIEDILRDLERAKDAWNKAKKEFKDMNTLVNMLRRSLEHRMQKWQAFRQYITLRTKLQFQFYLSERGFYGQVLINHGDCTLTLRVQTDDQKNKSGKAHEKDAKMSGGEKSFATICLLLSLWDAMGCPIRALDEFDVYMDAVNRKISMKMMLDAAKNSDKQHILITPQEMSSLTIGPEVRIHRMSDPERGQRTLPF